MGCLGGVRGSGETNVQGVLLNDMRGRCNLNAVSLGSVAVGPCYTYASGDQKTTVDYIFADEEAISMDEEAISMLSQCRTLPFEDLNTSDHLPLLADMMYVPTLEEEIHHVLPRVDWMKAVSSGDIENYRQEVAKCLNRLANNSYDCVEEVERELYYVSKLLCDSAVRSLPLLQHRKKLRWRDSTLTALCAKSRIARKVWREADSPSNGPLYDEKCHLRRAVRKRVRFCAAQAENRRIQRRDRLFSSGDKGHFRLPQRKKKVHTKLLSDGEIIEGTQSLLDAWSQHFEDLAKSRKDELPQLQSLESHVKHLTTLSLANEDSVLDVPFSTDEVSTTMKKIKRGKAPGPDNLMAEHLLEAGEAVVKWLTNIFNAIVSLEAILDSLKCGTTVPVYKGGGRDPLPPDSYRGITLSSVVSKVLEMLLLNRLETVFVEANIPHPNQSAYRKKVSCADTIFTTQEIIARYMGNGSRVFMCLYDLQKAFDSIEYPVLLDCLYAAGINGRCWRLIKNWYEGACCRVKIDEGKLSQPFPVDRGVKQGSILYSPTLFLLVMDPLLISLQKSGIGLSMNEYYAGGFLHAEAQVSAVLNFARYNFLKLNIQKCEIIPFSHNTNHRDIYTSLQGG